jgi:Zn-dependent M28 family amino/carboxypeptidase
MRIDRIWVVGAFAALLMSGCTVKPKEPPPSTDIDDVAFRDHVRVLASDDFMGRKPGTDGEAKTVAYLAAAFHKLGLKPGNGNSYVQQVPLVQITPDAAPILSVAGQKASRQLIYGQDMVIWTKRAQPQVEVAGSELVFVGYGIVAPEYVWDDYANVEVKGKTVIVLANDPGYASKDPAVFRGNAMTDYGRWAYKVEEAARHGAAGILLVHDPAQLGYGWNVIQATWSGAQFELAGADPVAARTSIEGWIQKDAARALFTDAHLEFERLAVAAAHPGFKAIPLGLKVDAALRNSIRAFNSANVIALLPGRTGHENVIYTAHWDSLGVDANRPGHNIFNGAADNATGVAGLLVLAQSFERTKPRSERSIVFLATTAAEPNLLGSRYYVENPIFPLRQTAAVINVDTMLAGGRTRDVSIIGFGNSDLEDIARAEALLQGRITHPEPDPQIGMYFRSDSYSFAGRGVPVLYVQSGIDSAARGPVWGKAQIDDYLAHRYRQPSDQYSPDWDVGGAVADLTLYYQIGLYLANSRRFPRWYADSEFRRFHHHASSNPGD